MLRLLRKKLLNPVLAQQSAIDTKFSERCNSIELQIINIKSILDNQVSGLTVMDSTSTESASCEFDTSNLNFIRNFEEYDEFIRKYEQCDFDGQSLQEFQQSYCLDFDSFVNLFGTPPPTCDPFSDEYMNWELSFFQFLSGREYRFEAEGAQSDIAERVKKIPTCDLNVETRVVMMRTYADFLEKSRPERGTRVLEMGFGNGNLTELLGRCGCIVTGVDASFSDSEYVKHRLKSQNIDAKIIHGTFYDIEKTDDIFDFVVFDASFHHCGEPMRLLEILNKKTSADCKVFFLNEMIYPHVFRPWGLVCLGGEPLLRIRINGWLELGFRTDFFEQLLLRTGFKLKDTYQMCNGSTLYEAVKNNL